MWSQTADREEAGSLHRQVTMKTKTPTNMLVLYTWRIDVYVHTSTQKKKKNRMRKCWQEFLLGMLNI